MMVDKSHNYDEFAQIHVSIPNPLCNINLCAYIYSVYGSDIVISTKFCGEKYYATFPPLSAM